MENEPLLQIWKELISDRKPIQLLNLFTEYFFKSELEDLALEIASKEIGSLIVNATIEELSSLATLFVETRFQETYDIVRLAIKEKIIISTNFNIHSNSSQEAY